MDSCIASFTLSVGYPLVSIFCDFFVIASALHSYDVPSAVVSNFGISLGFLEMEPLVDINQLGYPYPFPISRFIYCTMVWGALHTHHDMGEEHPTLSIPVRISTPTFSIPVRISTTEWEALCPVSRAFPGLN
jgi:hypothetical protein